MKKLLLNTLVLAFAAATLMSCEKSTDNPKPSDPIAEKKWVVYYKDVILGDQNNYTNGHFLKSKTGEVVKLENSSSQQNALTMMFFREYGGNVVFTFPGNAWEAQTIKNDTIDNPNRLIYQSPLGTNFWSATNLNTGELKYAGTLDGDMTSSEFNTLAASLNWSDFDATFKSYNSGDANLSFVNNYIFPSNGDIYQIQLNDEIRAFLLVKNVTKSPTNGSIRYDLIIEGGEEFVANPSTTHINPGKD